MGNALSGGSGWVLLVYVPRDRRLINQYASEHSQSIASGIPILALDMYEHAYHIDFGANARAYVDTFMRNIDWKAAQARYDDATKVDAAAASGAAGVRRSAGGARRGSQGDARRRQTGAVHRRAPAALRVAHRRTSSTARPGAIPTACRNGSASCRSPIRSWCSAPTAFTSAARPRSRCATPGFDAKYMKGGHSAWRAIGGPVKLYT